jgi:hypothetical protein
MIFCGQLLLNTGKVWSSLCGIGLICKESLSPPMTFTGLGIDKTRQGYVATMSAYIKRLTCLTDTATFKEYRTLRANPLWVANSRPDISAFVSMDGSVTEENFKPKHVQRIN